MYNLMAQTEPNIYLLILLYCYTLYVMYKYGL